MQLQRAQNFQVLPDDVGQAEVSGPAHAHLHQHAGNVFGTHAVYLKKTQHQLDVRRNLVAQIEAAKTLIDFGLTKKVGCGGHQPSLNLPGRNSEDFQ